MSFLFNRKENSEKDDAANRQEFDQLADTIRVIYDLAQETPQAALDEVKALVHRVKGSRALDKRQRAILNAFAHDTAGFIYLELKRPEEALSEMEKAVRTYGILQDKTPLVNNYLNQSRAWPASPTASARSWWRSAPAGRTGRSPSGWCCRSPP